MIAFRWIAGLARRRPARLAGPAAGVALGVALVGSLGAFTTTAKGQMTRRAVQQVPVDWQVEVQPGGNVATVLAAVSRRAGVRVAVPVGFATSTGFEASTSGSTQTTGPGSVLGLPAGYDRIFPGELRTLAGGRGVLLAQQTAANLHAGPGDTVSIGRPGLPSDSVRVDGVVDLPAADSLFQHVGAPPGAQPQAPPDNVVLLPADQWHQLFDPLIKQADATRMQVHARLDHRLPNDPSAAYARAASAARHLEADLAGTALVGNNLAATLDAARSDALYAEVLFLLLGLPGLFIAALLTRSVASSFGDSRRREMALLRTRGASLARLQRIAATEAVAVAGAGALAGVGLALVTGRLAFGAATYGATSTTTASWAMVSVTAGAAVTVIAVAVPARRDATAATVATARRVVGRPKRPLVFRYGLDVLLILASMLVFWATSRSHYSLVLAPEGVPTVSVSWWALAAPLLLWVGVGLLAWRITDVVLDRGRAVVRTALTPLVGSLRGPAAAALQRQRRGLAVAVVLLTLSGAFAISTAVFDSTYRRQVGVDALLTNGAPVTVTAPPGGDLSPTRVAGIAGVAHVEPLQHRFVYVGADLQDLYGVDPATIGAAGQLQDAYFAGGGARDLLDRLARQPDAALVSAETVQDFQLRPGDRLRLRLRDARTGRLTTVGLRYAGVVKEFPTAPTDSFVVANASYIAAQTGDHSVSTLLVSTHGASPGIVAGRVRRALGPSSTVTDIDHTRRVVGSSLTAVDLAGLTKIELAYALVFAIAASGLVLGLGLAQRRRAFAIVAALGASRRQQGAFARAEAAVLGILGGALAVTAGWAITHVLVKVLTGVFDPPPASLIVPWAYLATVAALAIAGTLTAVTARALAVRGPVVEAVRDL